MDLAQSGGPYGRVGHKVKARKEVHGPVSNGALIFPADIVHPSSLSHPTLSWTLTFSEPLARILPSTGHVTLLLQFTCTRPSWMPP